MRRWRVDEIYAEFERLLNHVRYDPIQQRTLTLQTRIGVDFYEPRLELFINHKIQAKYLKIMHLLLRTYLQVYTFSSISRHFLHLRQDLLLKIVLFLSKQVEIILKLVVRDLVVGLILAVICVVDLNCIVGEMDMGLEVVDIKGICRCADIAFLVPVCTSHSIKICHEYVMSDVEFALVVEERTIDILLDDECLRILIITACFIRLFLCLSEQIIKFIDLIDDYDAVASIAVLSWLDYPNISFFFLKLLVDVLCPLLKIADKLFVLWIFEPFFDVEGQRYVRKDVLANFSVIFFQIVEQCFFVSKQEVVLKMIVDDWLCLVVIMSFLAQVLRKVMNTIDESNIFVFLSYLLCGLSIIQVFVILLRLFFAASLSLHEKVPLKQLEIIAAPYLFVESILIFELFSFSSFERFHKIRRKLFVRTCQQ